MDEIELSASQSEALAAILSGKSGLLTGTAGTGKTLLIREAIVKLRKNRKVVVHTATTGIAAVLNQGVTLHSYMKLFPQDFQTPDGLHSVLARWKKDRRRWAEACAERRAVHTLIIDEVSMLDTRMFEWTDALLREMRDSGRPFGGLQVILVGDFYQLPPVQSRTEANKYLFESKLFWESMECMWDLKEIWRQADPIFCGILRRMRSAENTEEDFSILESRVGAVVAEEGIKPTRLYARNIDVDAINHSELDKLAFHIKQEPGIDSDESRGDDLHSYTPFKGFHYKHEKKEVSEALQGFTKDSIDKLLRDINLPATSHMRIGAQVMLTFNLSTTTGYVNGTRGVVVGFKRSIDGASPEKFHKKYSESELAKGEGRMMYPLCVDLPVVQFADKRKFVIPYVRWTRVVNGLGEVYIWHLPLRLAWAATMHRVQGQTLSHLDVALDSKVFENGQAFVAISRAQTLEGLTFSTFDRRSIRADPRVKDFYTVPFALQKVKALVSQKPELIAVAPAVEKTDTTHTNQKPGPKRKREESFHGAEDFVIVE